MLACEFLLAIPKLHLGDGLSLTVNLNFHRKNLGGRDFAWNNDVFHPHIPIRSDSQGNSKDTNSFGIEPPYQRHHISDVFIGVGQKDESLHLMGRKAWQRLPDSFFDVRGAFDRWPWTSHVRGYRR